MYFSNKGDSHSFPKDLPALDLVISYLDIAGTKHFAKYKMSTQIVMISGKGEFFEGYLESSRRI
jgi:hypothetical protein